MTMTMTFTDRAESEKGFTLVELAIVMLIIGLLIGGVLKGAELIGNAEIAATIAQLNNIEAAATGFRDKYDDFPGDMANADTRISGANATGGPTAAGFGNGTIATAPGVAGGAESVAFWDQLAASEFYQGELAVGGATVEGPINNTFLGVGYTPGAAPAGGLGAAYQAGHYLNITATPTGANNAVTLKPDQAGRMDRKSDDGNPTTGGITGSGDGTCGTAVAGYIEATQTLTCGLYRRFQS